MIKEEIKSLKNQDTVEITHGEITKVFKYIEPSFEEANLLFSKVQAVSTEVSIDISKFNVEYQEGEITAKVLAKIQADTDCKKALKECMKYSTLNDLPFYEAMKLSENWGFASRCQLTVLETIINNFMAF